MKRVLGAWLAMAIACSPAAFAQETSPSPEAEGVERNPVVTFLILEGFLAANAGMATLDPKAYGIFLALLSPLGSAETRGTAWVTLAAAESVAAYNITELDKDEYTDKEVFVANMIAWHAFVGVVGATAWLKGDFDEPAKVSFRYITRHDGGMLRVAYAF